MQALFEKGYSATYTIEEFSGGLRFRFLTSASGICSCTASCSDEVNFAVCPDDTTYLLDVSDSALTGVESYRQTVSFEDALGNTGEVVARAIHMTTPAAPTVTYVSDQINIEAVYTGAVSGDLEPDTYQYQVQRYRGADTNLDYLTDWTVSGNTGAIDYVADPFPVQGRLYGYRLRVRTEEGSTSQWSAWTLQHV